MILQGEREIVENGCLTGPDGLPLRVLRDVQQCLGVLRHGLSTLGLVRARAPRERKKAATLESIRAEYAERKSQVNN